MMLAWIRHAIDRRMLGRAIWPADWRKGLEILRSVIAETHQVETEHDDEGCC